MRHPKNPPPVSPSHAPAALGRGILTGKTDFGRAMPVRNLFFRYFPSPDFGGGAGVGADFFITCTENEIRGMSCFGQHFISFVYLVFFVVECSRQRWTFPSFLIGMLTGRHASPGGSRWPKKKPSCKCSIKSFKRWALPPNASMYGTHLTTGCCSPAASDRR
jgi:hypothetical protein